MTPPEPTGTGPCTWLGPSNQSAWLGPELWLPPEVWLLILDFVPCRDLCSVALTCTTLSQVAADPNLWAKIQINKKKIKAQGIEKLFTISRLSRIVRLDLSYLPLTVWDCTAIFNNVIQTNIIKCVNLHCVNLSGVDTSLVGLAISALEKVDLSGTKLTPDQCSSIFRNIQSSTSIQDVSLRNVNLSSVESGLISRATSRLVKADLEYTKLTPHQVTGILVESLSSLHLSDLDLSYNSLHLVPASLLALAVSRLNRVGLKFTKLTTDQVTALVTASLQSNTLTHISLYRVNLSDVSMDLLLAAKKKFKMYF